MSGCSTCALNGSCSSSGDGDSCEGEKKLPPGMLERYDTNQSTADGVLVFIETYEEDGTLKMHPTSAQLIAKAVELNSGRVFGVIFGGPEVKSLYDESFSYGVDSLYHVRDQRLKEFHPEAYAESITSVCERVIPASVLMASTLKGAELAPRVAASMGTGVVTNICGLELEGRKLIMFKDTGGKTMRYGCTTFPQVVTVKNDVFPSPEGTKDRKGTAVYWHYRGGNYKEIL
ncbi:MAG: hypothetical protein WC082_14860 [Victivallales bacterium]